MLECCLLLLLLPPRQLLLLLLLLFGGLWPLLLLLPLLGKKSLLLGTEPMLFEVLLLLLLQLEVLEVHEVIWFGCRGCRGRIRGRVHCHGQLLPHPQLAVREPRQALVTLLLKLPFKRRLVCRRLLLLVHIRLRSEPVRRRVLPLAGEVPVAAARQYIFD